jgi:hypothetical protein
MNPRCRLSAFSRLVGCEQQSDREPNSRQLVPVGTFPTFPDLKEEIMENTLVRRDQFNVTPQGIVHKPTAAAFICHIRATHIRGSRARVNSAS